MSSTLRSSRTALDWANQYIDRGLAPIPVPFREKGPKLPGWPDLRITKETAPQYFNGEPHNIGILLGEPSGNLADIDLDCREAVILAPVFLPATDSVFGRKTNRASHWLYRTPEELETEKTFTDPHNETGTKSVTLVELRSTGCQTVFPGSVHKNTGEHITFDKGGEPAMVDPAVLRKGVRRLAAASLLARHWAEGQRHEAAMALSGALINAGWDHDEAGEFVLAVAEAGGDDEPRTSEFNTTLKKILADEPAWGLPKLMEIMGAPVASKVAEWLELRRATGPFAGLDEADEIQPKVEELNREHAVTSVKGKTRILRERKCRRSGALEVDFMSPYDFRGLYCNEIVMTIGGGVPLGNFWWTSPQRKQYLGGPIFDPSAPVGGSDGYHYNMWQGFAVEPDPSGSCALYLEHIEKIVTQGNREYYEYILAWMADAVQNPAERPGVAFVMRGGQGVGKGTMASQFGALFGEKIHFKPVYDRNALIGNFNSHLQNTLVLFADEAIWAGDKASEGKLKALVTEPTHWIEYKGIDKIPVDNYIRVILASNSDWVVPANMDDRRFFVVDVDESRAGDHAYFKAIREQMNNGGREALMDFLLNYDLSGVNLRAVPKTEALWAQKVASMSSFQSWWYGCLERGWVLNDRNWDELMNTVNVHEAYQRAAKAGGDHWPLVEVQFGQKLNEIAIKRSDKTKLKVRPRTAEPPRPSYYAFGTLEENRERFAEVMQSPNHEWEDPEETDDVVQDRPDF